MPARQKAIEQMTDQLKSWAEQLDQLESKVQTQMADATATARGQMEQQLTLMRDQQAKVEGDLRKLRDATEAAYKDMQAGYERAAGEWQKASSQAWDRFKS